MKIEKIVSFDMDQNCYLVSGDGKEGFLIDPGADTAKIEKAIKDSGISVTHILLTHCHFDHTESVNALRSGRKLVSGSECSENIGRTSINLSVSTGELFACEPSDIILADGEEIEICGVHVKMIKTPGHTDCSVCYLADGVLFSGDTLFKRVVGRCDLPTGDERALIKSIKERIYTLPDETEVMPGHGAETLVGYEKKFNLCVN